MEKLLLVDGHSIINRAFYGVPPLTNAEGLHTNGIYGFLNILLKFMDEEKPDYLVVAFDVKHKTFRHEIYAEYKGTRKPMPAELHEQVPVLKEVLLSMGIKIAELPGFEADDILGTLATRAQNEGMEVALVSGDRDLLQIASEHIKICIPKTKGGKTETENYFAKDVVTAFGVTPLQFIDLKALMGDTADNIPGVPKIGKKTAEELMVSYGSLASIYEHLEEIGKNSVRESLRENKELADLSKILATININAPIELQIRDAAIDDVFSNEAYAWFKKLEFKKLLSRFEKTPEVSEKGEDFYTIEELSDVENFFEKIQKNISGLLGIYLASNETGKSPLFGVAVCYADKEQHISSVYIKVSGFVTEHYLAEKIIGLCQNHSVAIGNLKSVLSYLQLEDISHVFDVVIAAYLLNPLKNDYVITDVANEYLNLVVKDKVELFGKKDLSEVSREDSANFEKYACRCAYISFLAWPVLEEKLQNQGLYDLFTKIEMPLVPVLFSMEQYGIAIKKDALIQYGKDLQDKIEILEKEIYADSGCEFNIQSPKQLGEVLFEKMGLPGGKKTKTGYSTAADVLEKLANEAPVVRKILDYRGLTKLKSTYADGLLNYIDEDGRIHSTFNQTITATGRISSTDPNLQNIPVRTELGRELRKVFVPKDGWIFIDADYSQIELRILASMSKDEKLISAYKSKEDIHRLTASQVFHIPFEEVTDLQRRNAKAVNFGIVYGISSFGLSEDLSITKKEAAKYIEDYFATYPGVKKYLDDTVNDVKEKGFSVTLFGRIRPIPEINNSNFMIRSFGERVAMNSPIQGTAADIMKIAMIRIENRLRGEKLQGRMVLQVHDEVIIEAPYEEQEKILDILREEMEGACDLSVKLEIDAHTGLNWYEAK